MFAAAFFAPTVAINVQVQTVDAVVVVAEGQLRASAVSRNLVKDDPEEIRRRDTVCVVDIRLADSASGDHSMPP